LIRITLAVCLGAALALPASAQAWTSNHFYSPSGNIECRYWTTQPYGIGCYTFNNHRYAEVDSQGAVFEMSTPNDWWGHQSWVVLGYGQHYRAGFVRCRSYVRGMRCWSVLSGHGFFINRSGVRRW
jgi:hypothetical protein